jgi:SP family sugar:H+ symporter-like MFS transporter
VGITENAVPTYQSEIVPAGARGAVVSSIQFFIAVGGFISSGVNKRFSTDNTDEGWLVATCLQALFPMLIAIGLPFVPISPRWLISKGRSEEAVRVLIKVRPKEDGDNGACEAEVAAIDEALQHQVDKGPWLDLFRGTNARRTMIASVVFAFAQFTGQAFTSQYGPRFYTTVGLGSMAFTYSLINSAIGLLTCGIAMIAMDRVGRRPIVSTAHELNRLQRLTSSSYSAGSSKASSSS